MKHPYFTLSRKFLESDMWLSEKFTKGQAWVDLIGLANWRDKTAEIRGITIDVKRGEVARSKVFLAKRWGWSRGKVIRFLDELKMEQQIEQLTVQQKKNVTSLIRLINYDQYQLDGTANGTDDGTPNGTTKGKGKEITRGKSALDFFTPELNGWDKSQVEQTIDGFISLRKTNQISSGVLQKEFAYWKKYSNETINSALTVYVAGRHWEKSKGEKYLRGIIRGKDKEVQKENSQTLLQKAF
ncbi:MAG: hypothetical protein KKF12_11975 [Proteobacteria bacterium]|nr:hypothetical protein [Desulfobacula sp.]MBU3951653.1 hypothetical protein [Pseudomonadota bacterium]MBU4131530.1 hypothetical protein [Pseudomonadota bacterium]